MQPTKVQRTVVNRFYFERSDNALFDQVVNYNRHAVYCKKKEYNVKYYYKLNL